MLNNTPMNNMEESKKRKIMYIIIGIICAFSIIITIILQIKELNPPPEIIEEEEIEIIDFKTIFNNELNEQEYTVNQLKKIDEDKKVVYTYQEQSEKVDGKYDINMKMPIINIDNSTISSINKEIEDIFGEKARSIIKSEEDYEVIYTVEYTSYINFNILSLVIKSNLKEGTNAQRVIVKTYTYNISTNELLDIDEMISIKKLDKAEMQKEINNVVEKNAKQVQSLVDLGYNVYKRNLSDEMYKVEKINNFFYGPKGVLYIIYAYGNNSYTSELDVIPIL